MESKSDETLVEGQAYTSRVEAVSGSSPIEYFLARGPSGLEVNQTTGDIEWNSAVASEVSWIVHIRARNPLNYDDVSWYSVSVTFPLPIL